VKELYFFSDYLNEKYGRPLYRVPVDLPFSCPHRMKKSGSGCVFCPEDGARARHLKNNLNIKEQINSGVKYVKNRYNTQSPYIIYFQSFTNTFGDISSIRSLYSEALSCEEFSVLITATRPDCLSDEVLDYLEELNEKYELWVELGVQSANDKTLERINRGHNFSAVEDAVAKLNSRNIKSAAHVILGLPGETEEDFIYTARKLAELPFSGVKIHNLLVLRKTPLASIYEKEKFKVLNEYEYASALRDFLRETPEKRIIMRIQSDAPEADIIAPKWWMKKGQFLDYFKNFFSGVTDGGSKISSVKTDDGSYTLYHPVYKQNFHSGAGAQSESLFKFINPCRIKEKLEEGRTVEILDIGFGLGWNVVKSVELSESLGTGYLKILSLEKDVKTLEAALSLPEISALHAEILSTLLNGNIWKGKKTEVEVIFNDARSSVRKCQRRFDAVYLDAFSPDKNPELWTYDFIRKLKGLMKEDAVLATYSAAFPVKGALIRSGFHTGESPAFGRKNGGAVASLKESFIDKAMDPKERNIVTLSTAGLSYRDPELTASPEIILSIRKKTVEKLRYLGIPKWYQAKIK